MGHNINVNPGGESSCVSPTDRVSRVAAGGLFGKDGPMSVNEGIRPQDFGLFFTPDDTDEPARGPAAPARPARDRRNPEAAPPGDETPSADAIRVAEPSARMAQSQPSANLPVGFVSDTTEAGDAADAATDELGDVDPVGDVDALAAGDAPVDGVDADVDDAIGPAGATNSTSAVGERTDAELVGDALAGNRGAFGQLVDRYQKRAAWVAYRLLGNREDALEVCQESFIKAWSRLADLKEPEKFGSWLLRTVTNQSLNYRRDRRGGSGALSLDDAMSGEGGGRDAQTTIPGRSVPTGPAADMTASELSRAAREAIDRLPHKQRMALILFGLEGLPQQQVAEVLHTSVEAVKWHVFQARKKLREMLRNYL
jgi:RNA polymerase sigma-70 factor (ECF subfamily)